MPFISEAASAIKSRFGFHDRSSDPVPPVRSTPDIFKSASKENLIQSSAVRSIAERGDDQSFEIREDPSFWKDHNVQVLIWNNIVVDSRSEVQIFDAKYNVVAQYLIEK